MIKRYSRKEMDDIWNLENKFNTYLKVELAVCRAYSKLGKISKEDLEQIEKRASFSVARIDEIEKEVNHDVIAFLTNVNESLGEDLAKYMHVGLTSSDVIDTALALQIQSAGKIIKEDLSNLIVSIKALAEKHADTVCIGRSHGVHAEVMTFKVKLLSWIDAFERVKRHFEYALDEIRVGQISGPVGTYSNISPEIEKITCEILNLRPARISTQIIARDLHAFFLQSLAMIGAIIEQYATEIRHLQRTEVLEVEEGFAKNQKGSSAMPHKKNPVSCENLCGLSRIVKANAQAAMENICLWHERDISHSSTERIIFPDSTILIDYMLNRFKNVVDNLVVNEKNMEKNTKLYGGIIYSQKVMLKLIEKGIKREEAYRIVQSNALDAFDNNGSFVENLKADKNVLNLMSNEEIDECFDMSDYLKNIEEIYKRF
ncbi:MAG: adenylosuccinate lyase [bacterium]|nr:adenylosuccinate lyase [bacterium]